MNNLKIRAAIETAKLIGMSAAVAIIIVSVFYTVPAYITATGAMVGILLYFLHMIYEFKLESLTSAEKYKEFDNNSKV